MKKAFSMIELIFVIVIIGILALVVFPKFQNVASQAHISNLKSFVGSLNRTVAPSIWAKSVITNDGNVSKQAIMDKTTNLKQYIDTPKEILKIDITYCNSVDKIKIVAIGDRGVNGDDYVIGCKGSSSIQPPKFYLFKSKQNLAEENKTIPIM